MKVIYYISTLPNQGPKIVLTRICVAVSGLVIHSVPDHWPQPINDLISMFQPQLASGQVGEAFPIVGIQSVNSGQTSNSSPGIADGDT